MAGALIATNPAKTQKAPVEALSELYKLSILLWKKNHKSS